MARKPTRKPRNALGRGLSALLPAREREKPMQVVVSLHWKHNHLYVGQLCLGYVYEGPYVPKARWFASVFIALPGGIGGPTWATPGAARRALASGVRRALRARAEVATRR